VFKNNVIHDIHRYNNMTAENLVFSMCFESLPLPVSIASQSFETFGG